MVVKHPNNGENYAQDVTVEEAVEILIALMTAGFKSVIEGEGS